MVRIYIYIKVSYYFMKTVHLFLQIDFFNLFLSMNEAQNLRKHLRNTCQTISHCGQTREIIVRCVTTVWKEMVKKKKVEHKTAVKCTKCNVYLCCLQGRNCFHVWHTGAYNGKRWHVIHVMFLLFAHIWNWSGMLPSLIECRDCNTYGYFKLLYCLHK